MNNENNIVPLTLEDVSINSLLKYIPNIINGNNAQITNLVNGVIHFGDENSNHYIKLPVITNGIIKGNSGIFNNLSFSSIDSSTADTAFNDIIVNHQKCNNRFSSEAGMSGQYTHDASSIKYGADNVALALNRYETLFKNASTGVRDVSIRLQALSNDVDMILERLNINREYEMPSASMMMSRRVSNNTDMEFIDAYNSSTKSYTYPNAFYTNYNNITVKNESDANDIRNGKKFRYYTVDSIYTKINNQYECCLNTSDIGTETEIIIDNTHDNDVIIKLSYDGEKYNYVKIEKDDIELTRINLICTKIDPIYGAVWYIKNYNGKITLV